MTHRVPGLAPLDQDDIDLTKTIHHDIRTRKRIAEIPDTPRDPDDISKADKDRKKNKLRFLK